MSEQVEMSVIEVQIARAVGRGLIALGASLASEPRVVSDAALAIIIGACTQALRRAGMPEDVLAEGMALGVDEAVAKLSKAGFS